MVKKKYLWKNPKGYCYVRIKGKYTRIHAETGTAEFDQEYWGILNGKRATSKTSWDALITSYRGSSRWTNLKPRTRKDYDKAFAYIIEKAGTKDTALLSRKDVIAAMEANKDRVRFANYIVQIMSILMEHAIDLGWRKDNPAKGVRKLKTPEAKKQPHIPWPDAAVDVWRKNAAQLPLLIFELGVGSVQRPSDWTKFRWDQYDGQALKITQSKTNKHLYLPCTACLQQALKTTPRTGMTILTNSSGQPLSYYAMAKIMHAERERLGLLDYDLHALRYRGVMELAWAGCTDEEIASYSGHSSKDMIRKYAGEARQVMRAKQAASKRA